MTREEKIRKDELALKKYAAKLRRERMVYMQTFEAYAVNQRKSREAALGACALKAIDHVRELAKIKPLVDGTLEYVITEGKVKDEAGLKGFKCSVTFRVVSNEPAHDPEDILKEIMDTKDRMKRETDEMFPENQDEEAEG